MLISKKSSELANFDEIFAARCASTGFVHTAGTLLAQRTTQDSIEHAIYGVNFFQETCSGGRRYLKTHEAYVQGILAPVNLGQQEFWFSRANRMIFAAKRRRVASYVARRVAFDLNRAMASGDVPELVAARRPR